MDLAYTSEEFGVTHPEQDGPLPQPTGLAISLPSASALFVVLMYEGVVTNFIYRSNLCVTSGNMLSSLVLT